MTGLSQLSRAWAICKKDIKIYYLEGPVLIFGPLLPAFLFLAFYIGRELTVESLIPGLIAMTLFFTTTAVGPVVAPWETRMRVLERLVSAPISLGAILFGDALASLIFGLLITLVPLGIGLGLGAPVVHPLAIAGGLLIAAACFSYIGLLFSAPPADVPGNAVSIWFYAFALWDGKPRMAMVSLYGNGKFGDGRPFRHRTGEKRFVHAHWNWNVRESFFYPGADIVYLDAPDLVAEGMELPHLERVGQEADYVIDLQQLFSIANRSERGVHFDAPLPEEPDLPVFGVHWAVEVSGAQSCLGCTLPGVTQQYIHVCRQGPVFPAEEVAW